MDIRMALLKKNVYASFLLKACSAIFVFMLVPLTLKCLDTYQNGIWMAISSMLLWIDNMDIGLGNGLRNKLACYIAEGNIKKARTAVSSTMFMLIAIIIPTIILIEGFIACVNTYALLNVDNAVVGNLNEVLIVASILVCSTFVFKFIGNVYQGLQLPAISNLLVTCGQGLTLLITWCLYHTGHCSLMHIAIANTVSPLVVYLVAYPITFYKVKPELRPELRLVKLSSAKELFSLGWQFFVIQMASAVIFMTANMLLSHDFSPEAVTPYQVCYRYFSILLIGFTIIIAPFWSASTDACERKDFLWIQKAHRIMNRLMLVIAFGAVCMIFCSDLFYRIWINGEVEIPLQLTVAMAFYYLVIIISMRFSYFLNGFGVLKPQLICTVVAALLFLPVAKLSISLTHGTSMILYAMSLVQVPGLIVNYLYYRKYITNKQ